jgi:serine phosphatase RsbU (regulator of sigma subunit)
MDYFLDIRPLTKNVECGDMGIIKEFDHKLFIGIIDVAGHGKEAYKIAVVSKDFLEENYRKDLVEVMKGLHEHLKNTRGAVAGLFLLDLTTGKLKYVEVGNITARIFGANTRRIISKPGIIGYAIPTLREERTKLYNNDVLLLYTDGIKEHFELEDYPELLQDDARTITTNIINKFGKKNDDAACIALRFAQMEKGS